MQKFEFFLGSIVEWIGRNLVALTTLAGALLVAYMVYVQHSYEFFTLLEGEYGHSPPVAFFQPLS